jgi:DnaJ-class molecular chaperone
MNIKIPDDKNPYSERTPFKILGVTPAATGAQIRDAHEQRIEEINDAAHDEKTRLAKLAELKQAYNTLRDPQSRAAVEAFLLADPEGREECIALARGHQEVSFDYDRLLGQSDAVLATEPNPQGVDVSPRAVELRASAKADIPREAFGIDHRAQALRSITFES